MVSGAVLGGFLETPETPSEIVCAPMIRLGDKNCKELYILYYIMAFSIGKNFILLPLKSPSQR